jgi:hypothetical protein
MGGFMGISTSSHLASNLPSEVQALIRGEQERGYRNLAIKLGLGADPHKAYEYLSGSHPPTTSHSPYENPNGYQIMAMYLSNILTALTAAEVPWTGPEPALATLPSGNVSAQVRIGPTTRVPVIFFEQGLFNFLYDYCHLIGWAVPPIPSSQLSDEALTGLVHRYTMPTQASESFVASMYAYVFEGNPLVGRQKVPAPSHNIPLCMALLALMECFVMGHEMAHIKAGHLTNPSGGKAEFEADLSSLRLVTFMTFHDDLGWGFGYWACELAVLAFHLLYRSIRVAAFGGKDVIWTDSAHPEPVVRRDMLRQMWLEPGMPETGIMAARELCGMSDALIQVLWEFVSIPLVGSYEEGARPSPMWQPLIDGSFDARD